MNKQQIYKQIEELGLLAVIRGPSEQKTLKAVEALVKGGVTGIEITYSTPNANSVVNTLAREYGKEILLGMGTLTEPEQVKMAVDNGARFLSRAAYFRWSGVFLHRKYLMLIKWVQI